MEGRQDDGISFLSKTLNDWTVNKLSVFTLRGSQNANDEYNRPITNSTIFFPDKQTLIQFFSPMIHVEGNLEVEHMAFEEGGGRGWCSGTNRIRFVSFMHLEFYFFFAGRVNSMNIIFSV